MKKIKNIMNKIIHYYSTEDLFLIKIQVLVVSLLPLLLYYEYLIIISELKNAPIILIIFLTIPITAAIIFAFGVFYFLGRGLILLIITPFYSLYYFFIQNKLSNFIPEKLNSDNNSIQYRLKFVLSGMFLIIYYFSVLIFIYSFIGGLLKLYQNTIFQKYSWLTYLFLNLIVINFISRKEVGQENLFYPEDLEQFYYYINFSIIVIIIIVLSH